MVAYLNVGLIEDYLLNQTLHHVLSQFLIPSHIYWAEIAISCANTKTTICVAGFKCLKLNILEHD